MFFMKKDLMDEKGKKLLKRLGEEIVKIRREKLDSNNRPWSQEEFADRAGIHRTFAGSIERGERNMSFLNLIRICETLQIKPSELLERIKL